MSVELLNILPDLNREKLAICLEYMARIQKLVTKVNIFIVTAMFPLQVLHTPVLLTIQGMTRASIHGFIL